MRASCLRVKPRDKMFSSAADDNTCGILKFSSLGSSLLEPRVEVKTALGRVKVDFHAGRVAGRGAETARTILASVDTPGRRPARTEGRGLRFNSRAGPQEISIFHQEFPDEAGTAALCNSTPS